MFSIKNVLNLLRLREMSISLSRVKVDHLTGGGIGKSGDSAASARRRENYAAPDSDTEEPMCGWQRIDMDQFAR